MRPLSEKEAKVRYRRTPRGGYARHKESAKRRGVPFLLTFEQWWAIWEASGKWNLRGCKAGKYVMCRKEDKGAYEAGNVYIDSWLSNTREGAAKMRRLQGIYRKHRARSTTVMFEECIT